METQANALTPIDEFEDNLYQATAMLKSMANPHRLMLLCLLVDKELSVGQLNEFVPLSQSALSQHLAWLRREGLVATRRQEQTIFYRIKDEAVIKIIETLHSIYCE